MACESQMWLHAKNSTTVCPRPAITNCADCQVGLCSSHIVECGVCGRFICRECEADHQAKHEHVGAAAA